MDALQDALRRMEDRATDIGLGGKKIGDAGARALAHALKSNSSLRSLDLQRNNFGAQGARALAEALKTNSSLQYLNLETNTIGDDGARELAQALKENMSLQSLNLGYDNIRVEGARALAQMLSTSSSLQSLTLGYNSIGAEGARELAQALKTNSTLKILNLPVNYIANAGARALAEGLKTNSSLQRLVLWKNNIGNSGARALAEALQTNSSLQSLDLYQGNIANEGACALANALKTNRSLQSLELQRNRIGNTGALALGEALQTNTSLQSLGLADNGIGAEGALGLAAAVKSNTSLRNLDLQRTKLGKEGALALAEALQTNSTLEALNGRSVQRDYPNGALARRHERERVLAETQEANARVQHFFSALDSATRRAPEPSSAVQLFEDAQTLQDFRIAFSVWSIMTKAWAVDASPQLLAELTYSCLERMVRREKVVGYESVGLFKIFLRLLMERGVLTELQRNILDGEAEDYNTLHCEWVQELRAQVKLNAASIRSLEQNVTAIHDHLDALQDALKKQLRRRAVLGVVSTAISLFGAGIIDAFAGILDLTSFDEVGRLVGLTRFEELGSLVFLSEVDLIELAPSVADALIQMKWSEDKFIEAWLQRKCILGEAVPEERVGVVQAALRKHVGSRGWQAPLGGRVCRPVVHGIIVIALLVLGADVINSILPRALSLTIFEAVDNDFVAGGVIEQGPFDVHAKHQEQSPWDSFDFAESCPQHENVQAEPAPGEQRRREGPNSGAMAPISAFAPVGPVANTKRLYVALNSQRSERKVLLAPDGANVEKVLALAASKFGLPLHEFVLECSDGELVKVENMDDVREDDVVYLR